MKLCYMNKTTVVLLFFQESINQININDYHIVLTIKTLIVYTLKKNIYKKFSSFDINKPV